MLVITDLVARALLRIVWDVVMYGAKTPYVEGMRWRAVYGAPLIRQSRFRALGEDGDTGGGIDIYWAETRLIVWRQEFPGADLTTKSDVIVGFYDYEEN